MYGKVPLLWALLVWEGHWGIRRPLSSALLTTSFDDPRVGQEGGIGEARIASKNSVST